MRSSAIRGSYGKKDERASIAGGPKKGTTTKSAYQTLIDLAQFLCADIASLSRLTDPFPLRLNFFLDSFKIKSLQSN